MWKERQTALEEAASGKKPADNFHEGAGGGTSGVAAVVAAAAAAAARSHSGKDTDNKDEAEKEKVNVAHIGTDGDLDLLNRSSNRSCSNRPSICRCGVLAQELYHTDPHYASMCAKAVWYRSHPLQTRSRFVQIIPGINQGSIYICADIFR